MPDKKPNGLLIRPLAGADEARLCANGMASSEPWISLKRDAAHAFTLMSDPEKEVYVATQNGEIVGHCVLDMRGPFAGYVQVLFVRPECQSKGVGGALLKFAEQRIFRDSPNVFLCVSGFNPAAQRFYLRHGYETIGELKEYVIRGASEFLMRKTLGPKSEFQPACN